MTDIPTQLQRRRELEDRAAKLGKTRRRIQDDLTANTQAIIDMLRDARGSGIPYELMAELLGVSRQTVFKWREAADTEG